MFNVLSHFHMGFSAVKFIQSLFGEWLYFSCSKLAFFFFHRKARARPDKEGPPKSSWSVWRPQVVWTLTVGEDLMKPKEVLREGEEMD